jgi:Holliday junction resolvase RusA-like endonuclease
MITVPVKPMSQNKAFLGRKTKSAEYRVYTGNVSSFLPPLDVPEGQLKLTLDVYYSNRAADIDNCLKPFIDILQINYGFNDNKIYKLDVEKFIVKKGEEHIDFKIEAYPNV